METMSHILEACISQLGVLIRHHYADDYAVTYGCRMSQRKHSLIITTKLDRSVQPNDGKGEGVGYGKVVSPSPVDWRMVVASFPVNCNKFIPCRFMLCLNNVKSAAYKPRVTVDTQCIFTHVAGCQPPVLKGWTPIHPEKSSLELQVASSLPHITTRVATSRYKNHLFIHQHYRSNKILM